VAWRAIQDTVGRSESLAELSHIAERIYWRLLAHSDPWGRVDARPRKLRALCWPMLPEISDEEVGYALLEIETVGRIVVFERRGDHVVQLVDFEANQPRDAIRRRPEKSRFADPPDSVRPTAGLVTALFGLGEQTSLLAGDSGQRPAHKRTVSGKAADTVRGEETERETEKEKREKLTTLRASERELQDAHRSPASEHAEEDDPEPDLGGLEAPMTQAVARELARARNPAPEGATT